METPSSSTSSLKEEKHYFKDIIWNLIGQFVYLFGLWVITVLTTNIFESLGAGIFGLCLVAANICGSLAFFNLRLEYASDINKRYSDAQYFYLRLVLTLATYLMAFIYALLLQYDWQTITAILLFFIYKSSEFVSDILYGTMQRHGKLYIGGIFMSIKGVVSVAVYALFSYTLKDLNISLIAMGVAVYIVTFIEWFYCKKKLGISFKWEKGDAKQCLSLFLVCLPLFIVLLCSNLLPSIPKLFFEKIYTAEEFGLYNSIATVAVLIQTAAASIAIPIVPKIAEMFEAGDKKGFFKWSGLTTLAILLIGIIGVIAVLLLGDWALHILYQGRVDAYSYTFVYTIIAGTLTALFTVLTQVLGGMKSRYGVMIASVIGTAICFAVSYPFCYYQYMNGVSYALMVSIGVEFLFGLIFVYLGVRKMGKKEESKE